MSDYKTEVKRTEQLGSDYQAALSGIIAEIKKDDSLSPNRILDIVGCIQSIKGTRKRWASGGSSSLTEITSSGAVLNLRNVKFELGVIHITKYRKPIENANGGYYGAQQTILLNFIENYHIIESDTFWQVDGTWYHQNPWVYSGTPRRVDKSGSEYEQILTMILGIPTDKRIKLRFIPDDSYKNNIKWIAYEK